MIRSRSALLSRPDVWEVSEDRQDVLVDLVTMLPADAREAAAIEMGTLWLPSSRFRAVTVISSIAYGAILDAGSMLSAASVLNCAP